jgi:hypothetical protein
MRYLHNLANLLLRAVNIFVCLIELKLDCAVCQNVELATNNARSSVPWVHCL